MGQEEVAALFRVCAEDESPAGRRDAAMFAVLYGGGLRRAELCGLDLTDFDTADCSLTVRGKGRRERTVYLPEGGGCEHLKVWIEVREDEPGPLFCPVRMTGEVPISRLRGETLWYVLKRRQREAGLEGVTPHGFRRAYEASDLDAGRCRHSPYARQVEPSAASTTRLARMNQFRLHQAPEVPRAASPSPQGRWRSSTTGPRP